MKAMLGVSLSCALLWIVPSSWAQEPDAEGCKDSPIITRMPGSKLSSCDDKEYEQARLPFPEDALGNSEKVVEGEYHTWDYTTRDGVSEIQVFRNFETALKRAGFTIDYELSPSQITAHKANTWFGLENRGTYYDQTIVIEKAMDQEITASDLSDQLTKNGHVAIYGIHFDTGKATIQPDSEPVLLQIVQLMIQNRRLSLQVEGHTDNQGTAATNQALSEKRAQAVTTWLMSHGIPASRLTARGFGASKPIADNNSEEGRAKNRRVELAKP